MTRLRNVLEDKMNHMLKGGCMLGGYVARDELQTGAQ